MLGVHARRMASGSSIPQNVFTPLFACPAGRTAIVKAAVLTNTTPTARNVRLSVRTAGGPLVDVRRATPLAVGASLDIAPTEIVLNPGDTLEAWHQPADTSNNVHFFISGSLLTGSPV